MNKTIIYIIMVLIVAAAAYAAVVNYANANMSATVGIETECSNNPSNPACWDDPLNSSTFNPCRNLAGTITQCV